MLSWGQFLAFLEIAALVLLEKNKSLFSAMEISVTMLGALIAARSWASLLVHVGIVSYLWWLLSSVWAAECRSHIVSVPKKGSETFPWTCRTWSLFSSSERFLRFPSVQKLLSAPWVALKFLIAVIHCVVQFLFCPRQQANCWSPCEVTCILQTCSFTRVCS